MWKEKKNQTKKNRTVRKRAHRVTSYLTEKKNKHTHRPRERWILIPGARRGVAGGVVREQRPDFVMDKTTTRIKEADEWNNVDDVYGGCTQMGPSPCTILPVKRINVVWNDEDYEREIANVWFPGPPKPRVSGWNNRNRTSATSFFFFFIYPFYTELIRAFCRDLPVNSEAFVKMNAFNLRSEYVTVTFERRSDGKLSGTCDSEYFSEEKYIYIYIMGIRIRTVWKSIRFRSVFESI